MIGATACFAVMSLAHPKRVVAQNWKAQPMHLRLTFADQEFTATLDDNPSARDLIAMLPLNLTISDYSTNEKIAYLPRKLTEEGSGQFENEAPGDICYFAPWGNLAMFHGSYRWSRGLIRLGRLDDGIKPLLVRGEYPLGITVPS
jgi:hypothetical protein